MTALVPDAVGVRAHTLMRGTTLLMAYRERGIAYEASDLFDGRPGLSPFSSWTGLTRLPIWFEDDVHLLRGLPCTMEALNLEASGLKVMTFHPVLAALNASDLDGYAALKADLAKRGVGLTEASEDDFAPFRQDVTAGTDDLFEAVVTWLTAHTSRAGGCLRELSAPDMHRG